MRLLLLLGLLAFARCFTQDEKCMVHMSCSDCLVNSCAWCYEGFCTQEASSLCLKSNSTRSISECGSISHHRRQTVTQCPTFDAADITSVVLDTNACSTCSTQGCNLCVDSNTLFFACTNPGGSSACAQGPYTLPPSSIEPNFVLDIQCPVFPSPTTFSGLLIATFVTTTPVTENIIVFYIAYGVAAAIGQQYSVTLVEIVSIQLGSRSTSSQVSFKLSAVGSLSASQVAGALATAVNNGTSPLPIVGGITGPGVPTPSPAPTSSSGGSGISLSKGALAGIIIGCILGALLLALIIAYLLLRRQNNYMHPFRAPAAAYRP